jgi:hypothetical protein
MSENKSQALVLASAAQALAVKIDEQIAIVAQYDCFGANPSPMGAFALSSCVQNTQMALTDEAMDAFIMPLMNSDAGFRTDRDPNLIDTKTGKPFAPYTRAEVRAVMVPMLLRGFLPVNNEVNIIAGRLYVAKNGFSRKVRTHRRVTDFRDTYEVPRIVGDKGAIVKCRAEWKQDGVQQFLDREFPVRVNANMGADAILGKCQRKLLAAVHDRLTGQVTPEGEVGDDVVDVKATVTPTAPEDVFKKAQAAQKEKQPTTK